MSELLKGHALVIGINKYLGTISPLQSAVKDAEAMSKALEQQHGYDVTCLLDEEASADAIYSAIENQFANELNEQNAFLLYFAGHGVARGDGSEGPKGYLLPQNAVPGDPETWVSMERIREALNDYQNRHMLVILDCCFAGSFRWTSTREVFIDTPLYESQFQRFLRGQAWQVLTSASHDEKAMDVAPGRDNTRDELTSDGHSPFAAALLSGLSGNADSAQGDHEPDGVITATELYQYAYNKLVPAGARSHQTPGIWPLRQDNEGQYVFKNPNHEKNTIPDPPLDDSHNPWIGLKSYQLDDASIFFGREEVIDDIMEKIGSSEHHDFIAVVGASGTGKSSVVKAGVLPRLRDDGWEILLPDKFSASPLESLKKPLEQLEKLPSDKNAILFIDQFEELYTLCHNEKLREEYLAKLKMLIEEDNKTYVAITLRSDFEPRLTSSKILGGLWKKHKFKVPAFSADDFRQCIEGPAGTKAMFFENEDLIADIVDEVMAMPGALPLLSFSLAEMYRAAQLRRRETGANDRAILRVDYDSVGGVVGSLDRRASDLFDQADDETQATIKRVFLRMLSQDGARIARRRISLDELQYSDHEEQKRVDSVINDFVNARLLVIDDKSVEPAHDSLVVAWKMLLDWLSKSGPQVLLRALWRAATDWETNNHEKGLTWHDDPRLPQAIEKIKENELNALEQRFVLASEQRRKVVKRTIVSIGTVIIASLFIAISIFQNKQLENERIAEEANVARLTRDTTFLNILEQGRFFKVRHVLGDDKVGGVLETNEPWRPLITVSEGELLAGLLYGEGRILAVGHEAFLTFFDKNYESLVLDLSLEWLVPEKGMSIYFTNENDERLPISHADDYILLREVLSLDYKYDLSPEELPFVEAVETASLVIIANAWKDFTQEQIDAIEKHVRTGGGLLVAGLGWSWVSHGYHTFYNEEDAISAYPMNQLMAPFGLKFSQTSISPERHREDEYQEILERLDELEVYEVIEEVEVLDEGQQ